jgi:ABC-type dipeptide/oligopeptide/nickel transport system permease component
MVPFVFRRLFYIIPVILGVSVCVFLIIHLMPGDPARIMAGIDASEADVRLVRHSLRLDEPLHLQYIHFIYRAAIGDLGISFRTRRPVIEEIGSRYLNTLLLGTASILVAILLGGITGIISAVRKYSIFDNLSLLVSLAGVSMPTFYLGLLLMLFFSVKLGWFPLAGMESWSNVVLPAVTLGTPSAAVISRMVRSSLVDVLDQDYIRTARAKGLKEWVVIGKHALRNAMINAVTVVGLQVGYLLGGAVVTETVFAWPGIGRLVVQSILARDFPVVQAAVLILAITFVVVNLLTDLLYGLLDPRISIQ